MEDDGGGDKFEENRERSFEMRLRLMDNGDCGCDLMQRNAGRRAVVVKTNEKRIREKMDEYGSGCVGRRVLFLHRIHLFTFIMVDEQCSKCCT